MHAQNMCLAASRTQTYPMFGETTFILLMRWRRLRAVGRSILWLALGFCIKLCDFVCRVRIASSLIHVWHEVGLNCYSECERGIGDLNLHNVFGPVGPVERPPKPIRRNSTNTATSASVFQMVCKKRFRLVVEYDK